MTARENAIHQYHIVAEAYISSIVFCTFEEEIVAISIFTYWYVIILMERRSYLGQNKPSGLITRFDLSMLSTCKDVAGFFANGFIVFFFNKHQL